MATTVANMQFHALFGRVLDNWGWFLALGVLFVALGVLGLGYTFVLTVASVLFYGILLLVGAGAQIVDAFKAQRWKGKLLYVGMALLYVVAGAALISHPVLSSVALTWVLAVAIVAVGLVRMVLAFQHRGAPGWGWLLTSAVLSVVLGVLILMGWPSSSLWVIGMFVALEMIISGSAFISLGLAARRVRHDLQSTPITA